MVAQTVPEVIAMAEKSTVTPMSTPTRKQASESGIELSSIERPAEESPIQEKSQSSTVPVGTSEIPAKNPAKRAYWNALLLVLGYFVFILSTLVANGSIKVYRETAVNHAAQQIRDIRNQIEIAVKDLKIDDAKKSSKEPVKSTPAVKLSSAGQVENLKELTLKVDVSVNRQLQQKNPLAQLGRLLNPLNLVNALLNGMLKLFGIKSK